MSGPKPAEPGTIAGCDADEEADTDRQAGSGLTDLDCYALLSTGGLGGRNGFTLEAYARLSDRQIGALLSIEHDEDGRLVTEASRGRTGTAVPSGSIAAAGRELPSPEMLGFSESELQEALVIRPMVPVHYWSLFASVWARRGKSKDEIKTLWIDHLNSEN